MRSTIERVWSLHAQLADPRTRELVGKMDKIPTAPGRHTLVYAALDVAFLERASMLGELPRWRALAADVLRTGNA